MKWKLTQGSYGKLKDPHMPEWGEGAVCKFLCYIYSSIRVTDQYTEPRIMADAHLDSS